ncbi:MAG: 30S ribosomal protein S5 [archaeon]|jgi:small subunit ribosomal protein S5|nr:30S ribosomal protein S5 [archaeon]
MAEKDIPSKPKDLVEATPEELAKIEKNMEDLEKKGELPIETRSERLAREREEGRKDALAAWVPKTELGKRVKSGKEKDLDKILASDKTILEPEIVDLLIHIDSDLLSIGQAKGKFGGGKRRAWRQTQKKTMEGNVTSFSSMAVVGDRNGHVGIGMGKAKETLPAREKAIRLAKLGIIKVQLGFETKEAPGSKPHTVPFIVEGKCGSVRIKLIPAPRGTGLVVGDECKKILRLAGIEDVYGVTKGQTRTVFNLAKACIDALIKTNKMIT